MSIATASDTALGIAQEERLQRALADESAFAWIVETLTSDIGAGLPRSRRRSRIGG